MLPYTYAERKKLDEEGKEVTLRCPLIGLKAFEVDLDLEGVNRVCTIQRMGGLTRDFMMDVGMGLLYFEFRQTSPTEQSMPITYFVPRL